jgi:hypothetical protein
LRYCKLKKIYFPIVIADNFRLIDERIKFTHKRDAKKQAIENVNLFFPERRKKAKIAIKRRSFL